LEKVYWEGGDLEVAALAIELNATNKFNNGRDNIAGKIV
jgi:hypothetical protein